MALQIEAPASARPRRASSGGLAEPFSIPFLAQSPVIVSDKEIQNATSKKKERFSIWRWRARFSAPVPGVGQIIRGSHAVVRGENGICTVLRLA